MSPSRKSAVLVFALALALYALTAHRRVFTAGNDAARFATIESIVDRGTTAIDGSMFAGTVDQVRLDGGVYANKPPLLAFVGAAIYAPVQLAVGWRFTGRGAANLVHLLVVLLVGVPAAALAARFFSFTRELARGDDSLAWLLTAGLALGTLVWPYATTLNAHVPAAAALFFSFVAARGGRAARSGAWCGLAAALDLLPGAGFAPFFGWIARREKREQGVARFLVAFSGVALVAALANLAHHGSFLPLKMVPGAVDLSAKAGQSLFGVVLPESPLYPVSVLLGWHGLFTVSPILVFGAVGLWVACRAERDHRGVWIAVALGIAVQVAVHAVLAGSYGGWSWGYRYLLPIQPFLLLFALFALEPRKPGWRGACFAAFAISTAFAALGAYHPWPPAYEQESSKHPVASIVTNPIGGNAAAFLVERWPESAAARAATRRFVSADPEAARRYFALFFGSKGDLQTMRRLAASPPAPAAPR